LVGSGGRNVFLVRPQDGVNLNQMIDSVASEGYIIVEEYLPQA
jgi:glutathione synthase